MFISHVYPYCLLRGIRMLQSFDVTIILQELQWSRFGVEHSEL